jgi:nucleoside-diphosphate-sugar epimerase
VKVLVTGDRGYIGSVLTPYLTTRGHIATGVDTNYYDGCDFSPPPASYRQLTRDIRDLTPNDLSGYEAVVHLAALSNDPLGNLRNEWTMEINHAATLHVAAVAKEAGVQRFVYASSCSMYGASGDSPVDETAPLAPLTAYAASKVEAERGLAAMADDSFSPTFLRNATAYGLSPRLRLDIVLNNFTASSVATGAIEVLSDGTPWRPLVHIEDIAQAVALVLEYPRTISHNEAFNVGADAQNYRVRDLARIVADVTCCKIHLSEKPSADARSYRVSFGKLRRCFPDFQVQWTAESGAAQLYDAFSKYPLTLSHMKSRDFIRVHQLDHLLATGRLDSRLRWHEARVA